MEFAQSANSKAKIRQGCRIFAAQGIEVEILVCPAREGHTRLERKARFPARSAGNAPKKGKKAL
jgi:hypothetical protein